MLLYIMIVNIQDNYNNVFGQTVSSRNHVIHERSVDKCNLILLWATLPSVFKYKSRPLPSNTSLESPFGLSKNPPPEASWRNYSCSVVHTGPFMFFIYLLRNLKSNHNSIPISTPLPF